MWLLAGCHLFSSGDISETCEDVAACDDSGPIPDEPSRLLAALACSPCTTDTKVAELRRVGVKFRNDIVSGPGGKQILCEDPSGNAVELFQPGG